MRSVLLIIVLGFLTLPDLTEAFEQADLERLLQTNECKKCDLSGASLAQKNLAQAVLAKANLQGADLRGAVLRMADLEGANLRNADLSGTVLEAADLFQADLAGAIIKGAIFDGAYLVGTMFDKGNTAPPEAVPSPKKETTASLESESAKPTAPPVKVVDKSTKQPQVAMEQEMSQDVESEEDLREQPAAGDVIESAVSAPTKQHIEAELEKEAVQPEEILTTAAKIAPPKLQEQVAVEPVETLNPTAVQKAQAEPEISDESKDTNSQSLTKADLLEKLYDTDKCLECDLSGMNLSKASLKGAYLERVNLEGANLEKANLKNANLKAANLRNANLQGANLEGADLYKADLEGANLAGADLEGAAIDGAYLGDANLSGANMEDVIK